MFIWLERRCVPLLPRETRRAARLALLRISSAGSDEDGVAFATSAAPSQQKDMTDGRLSKGDLIIDQPHPSVVPAPTPLTLYWLDGAMRQPLMPLSALSVNRGHGELLSSQSDSATKRTSRGMLTATRYLQGNGTRSSIDEEIRSHVYLCE